MYPLLVSAFVMKSVARHPNFPDFQYPEEALRDGFMHYPVLSFCRRQAEQAIREAGGLADIPKDQSSRIRWRVSAGYRASGLLDAYNSRLELFVAANEDESVTPEKRPLRLVYSAPICGPEFDALPLVLRLGIELLIRKECDGSDPE